MKPRAQSVHKTAFKRGSRTYFNSSLFFPRAVRDDVFVLYGFVRTADNYVDAVPQDAAGFRSFRERYDRAVRGQKSGDVIVDSFVELMRRTSIERVWVDAFLDAMAADLKKNRYATIDETIAYMYGSAEVVGLFMCAILGLPERLHDQAKLLGRSMQIINFVRDIAEDNEFDRTYLPIDETRLPDLNEASASADPDEFRDFITRQLARYAEWRRSANGAFAAIPRRYMVPIKTAAEMYDWTAERIRRDPFIVYRKKVKPSRLRIFSRVLANTLTRR